MAKKIVNKAEVIREVKDTNKSSEEGNIEKPKKDSSVFLNKYLKNKNYNNMQIVAVEANLKSKIEQNTIEEWDKIFANILNKRLG